MPEELVAVNALNLVLMEIMTMAFKEIHSSRVGQVFAEIIEIDNFRKCVLYDIKYKSRIP